MPPSPCSTTRWCGATPGCRRSRASGCTRCCATWKPGHRIRGPVAPRRVERRGRPHRPHRRDQAGPWGTSFHVRGPSRCATARSCSGTTRSAGWSCWRAASWDSAGSSPTAASGHQQPTRPCQASSGAPAPQAVRARDGVADGPEPRRLLAAPVWSRRPGGPARHAAPPQALPQLGARQRPRTGEVASGVLDRLTHVDDDLAGLQRATGLGEVTSTTGRADTVRPRPGCRWPPGR